MRKTLLPALLWGLPLLCLSAPAEIFMLMSAILLHEGGHLFGFFLTKEPCPALSAVAAGLLLDPARPIAYKREIVILLLGPLANLLLAGILFSVGEDSGIKTAATVHLLTGLCNLFPLRQNDGGRVISDILALLLLPDTAERVASLIFLLALFSLLFLFLFFLLSPGGSGIILLLVALLSRACAPAKAT